MNGDTVRVISGLFLDKVGVVREADASKGVVKIESEGNILELEANCVEKF
jgi:transcription antitermination factor NusG